MNIGDILKQRRKSKGMTQVELAQKANMSQAQISQRVQGVSDNVTLGNLRNLAKALHCMVVDLLPEEDKNSTE